MEFDRSKVYTALNADELKAGSKVILADSVESLERRHLRGDFTTLERIESIAERDRFFSKKYGHCNLAYLISEPEEKKLKWTNLKIGDVVRNGVFTHLVTGIHNFEQTNKHIFVSGAWLTDEELEDWEKVEE